jgi:acyl carrier protein
MIMDLHSFLQDLAKVMEVDVVELHDPYELVWESILTVSTITLLSKHFDLTVDVYDLLGCKTIGDLCQLVRTQRRAA